MIFHPASETVVRMRQAPGTARAELKGKAVPRLIVDEDRLECTEMSEEILAWIVEAAGRLVRMCRQMLEVQLEFAHTKSVDLKYPVDLVVFDAVKVVVELVHMLELLPREEPAMRTSGVVFAPWRSDWSLNCGCSIRQIFQHRFRSTLHNGS